jgi:hypothetical protein
MNASNTCKRAAFSFQTSESEWQLYFQFEDLLADAGTQSAPPAKGNVMINNKYGFPRSLLLAFRCKRLQGKHTSARASVTLKSQHMCMFYPRDQKTEPLRGTPYREVLPANLTLQTSTAAQARRGTKPTSGAEKAG